MAKYVMSDLHGMYDKFIEMLKLIDFKPEDELTIIGDVFDRGPDPLKIIDYIVNHKNITLLKGNHDKMFEEYFETGDMSLWKYNGGMTSLNAIIKAGPTYEESLYRYIRSLPLYKVIDNKYLLVHASFFYPENYNDLSLEEFLAVQDEETLLWSRANTQENKSYKDYITISGHTVVMFVKEKQEDILRINNCIYIDCGACFTDGKLGCLRLDDMKEFYI